MIALLRSIAGKLAALSILAVLAYCVMAFIVSPLAANYANLEDGIAGQRALLGGLLAAVSKAEAGQASSSGENPVNPAHVYLDGESDAIRVAGLQSILSEAAQGIGARLSSTQAVQARIQKGVRLVGVQTQLTARLEHLQKFIFELETARPRLFIETLHVSRGPDREGQEVSDLDVRLVVLGAAPREVAKP